MTRIARIVIPGIPRHVTLRGNRRQVLFADEDDYAVYRALLAQRCQALDVAIWSYCLMPNPVHMILVAQSSDALARAVDETHRRYSGYLKCRLRVSGHVFQDRFASVAMDERHFVAAVRSWMRPRCATGSEPSTAPFCRAREDRSRRAREDAVCWYSANSNHVTVTPVPAPGSTPLLRVT